MRTEKHRRCGIYALPCGSWIGDRLYVEPLQHLQKYPVQGQTVNSPKVNKQRRKEWLRYRYCLNFVVNIY